MKNEKSNTRQTLGVFVCEKRDVVAEICRLCSLEALEILARDIKAAFDKQSEERAYLLSVLNSRREWLGGLGARWHIAPDGSNCCCTAEDRQYGLGCR